jgi:hypothetical protein
VQHTSGIANVFDLLVITRLIALVETHTGPHHVSVMLRTHTRPRRDDDGKRRVVACVRE